MKNNHYGAEKSLVLFASTNCISVTFILFCSFEYLCNHMYDDNGCC